MGFRSTHMPAACNRRIPEIPQVTHIFGKYTDSPIMIGMTSYQFFTRPPECARPAAISVQLKDRLATIGKERSRRQTVATKAELHGDMSLHMKLVGKLEPTRAVA